MADQTFAPRLVGLYLRLSIWLVPTFLAFAAVGLSVLSRHVVTDVERQVTMRVGNLSARVAGGLEALDESFLGDAPAARIAGQQLVMTLMSDPAIECAELRDLDDTVLLEAPQGLGCHPGVSAEALVLPVFFNGDADLVTRWRLDEVNAARTRQREVSMVILIFGLLVALLTNWLAFRVIIGRPLHDLVSRVERARVDAEHNALHDSLTGLPNRRHLDLELDRRAIGSRPITVLHIDLDGFKPINDTLGHAAGDLVLRHVADTLRKCTDSRGFIARTGGDEFLAIASDQTDLATAGSIATRLIERLSQPVEFEGEYCRVGASIGIATDLDGARRLPSRELLANADIALYRAKALGRGQWVAFSADMRTEAEARRMLADEMHTALERGEFIAHYQPQVSSDGQHILGLEALARWQHPRLGLIQPAEFIGVAEEVALVDRIDQQILHRAIADVEQWAQDGLDVPPVSVNVSAKRLNSPGLLPELRALRIPRGKVVFEVLETAYLDQAPETTVWNIEGITEMGIEIEIDDFGTGRASIASVLALRPTRVKVAREIVQAYADLGANRQLLEAIVAMGRSMGVGLVAEGVETEEQFLLLRDLGFEKLQGFAFSRPTSAGEISDLLAGSGADLAPSRVAMGDQRQSAAQNERRARAWPRE